MWIVLQQQKNMLSNTYKTGLCNKIVGEKCAGTESGFIA